MKSTHHYNSCYNIKCNQICHTTSEWTTVGDGKLGKHMWKEVQITNVRKANCSFWRVQWLRMYLSLLQSMRI